METFTPASKALIKKAEVLIVEDAFIIADNLGIILTKNGYQVMGIAKNIYEAREFIHQKKPDLVLLDIHLEKENDGLDFSLELKEAGVPFVFVTSYADEKTVERAKKSNPTGYLVKPFTEKDIYAAVEIAMHKAALENISKQEYEKRVLLDVSTAIAKVRGKDDLWHVIVEKIKPIFNCSDAVISLISDDGKRAWIYLKEVMEAHTQHPGTKKVYNSLYFIDKGHPRSVLPDDEPLIWNIEKGLQEFPDTDYLQIMYELGVREGINIWIEYRGKKMGMLNLYARQENHFSTHQFELLQGIANQLAVAISNILANEELQKREQEKTLQIAVTNVFKSGEDWHTIFRGVAREINTFVPIDFLNLLFPRDQKSFNCQKNAAGEFTQHMEKPDFLKGMNMGEKELKESMERFGRIYQTPDYYTGEKYDRFCQQNTISRQARDFYGLNSCMFIPISLPNGKPAVLILGSRLAYAFDQNDFNVIRRLASQIVTAMENLLVYDEVQKLNHQLQQEKEYLEEEVEIRYNFGEIVGAGPAIKEVYNKVQRVASTNTTVLITGETGTGKELIARAIHQNSPRRDQTFVRLNCAALPKEIIESELFGHVKGAFTGALRDRVGKFGLAHKGTIFLDEVGELPLEIQAKLLRVLQEREIEPIGSDRVQKVDVRILAATNRLLEKEVQKGSFRSDLYYRLKIFPIHLPPLRERKEDIPLLAGHFLKQKNRNIGKNIKALSDALMNELITYDWPGNIRELEHVIERAVILGKGNILDFRFGLENAREAPRPDKIPADRFVPKTLQEAEIELIMNTLKLCRGKVSGPGGAAEMLGINSNTLESRLKKHGIRKKHVMDD